MSLHWKIQLLYANKANKLQCNIKIIFQHSIDVSKYLFFEKMTPNA